MAKQPQSLNDVARRRREEMVGLSISNEMLAEQIIHANDGCLIARDLGREYKIEVKVFELNGDSS